ncbi:MAG: VENN motif pre-toxin domain-containing protein, partial [Serratia liquefaciens]|nr:VENN motif pre-toxin domain-containing protein [Serratia liquefaciens]
KAANEKMNNVTDADRQAAADKLAKEKPGKVITDKDINAQIYQTAYNQAFSESGYGTGGKVQQGMQAAVAAVQGLAGGDLKAAIAGGAAPYLAEQIHRLAPNEESRIIAHAVVAGALAELQGQSAAAGAAGAATAALGTKAIAEAMFGTSDFSKMSEEQRQTVSALATLAGGLAGGLASGDTAGAVVGGQSGKNTSENNDQFGFPAGMVSSGQAAFTLGKYMKEHGATPEQITAAQSDLARGLGTGAPQPATEFVKAWALLMSGVGGAVIAPTAGTAAVIGGGTFGGISDAGKQLLTMKPNETYSYTDTLIAIGTGALTQGKGLVLSEAVNTSGAYLGSKVKGEDATGAVTGALFGTFIGYKGGEKITEKIISKGISPITAEASGVVGGGVAGTVVGAGIEAGMKAEDKKNEK